MTGTAIKPVRLRDSDIAVLRSLRNNGGLTYGAIVERLGRNGGERALRLIKKGLVLRDPEGFYSLTEAGRDRAPYRNSYLEAKRQEALHAR